MRTSPVGEMGEWNDSFAGLSMQIRCVVRMFKPAALGLAAACMPGLALAQAVPDVIHSGTTAWFSAAKVGRADMLVIGDSTVLHNGDGWDTGFNLAMQNTPGIGLAGSGLQNGYPGEGEQYIIGSQSGSAFDGGSGVPVPAGYAGYTWKGIVDTAGSTPAGTLLASVTESAPKKPQGGDWTLYTAAGPGGGSVSGFNRYGEPPYSMLQTIPTTPLSNPATGLQKTVLHLDQAPNTSLAQEYRLDTVTNAAIFYSRVTTPGAPGATITSWQYGGRGTKDFLQEQYLNGGMTAAGRQAWLNAIVDGGSGKLNIVIAEGFNDRNEFGQLSADGIHASSTPEGFSANMQALIGNLRADWAAGGNNASNLSFTLLGMYPDIDSQQAPIVIQQYAAEEAKLAAADAQISFVDLFGKVPDYNTAVADGYMYDAVHLSRDGAIAYGQVAVNALVPEPSSLGLVGIAFVGLFARRRRSR